MESESTQQKRRDEAVPLGSSYPETTRREPQEPYIGPRPFEPGDRQLFFGRDREIHDLVSLVIAHRVVLLHAQSGAGKTSIINAGLVPALRDEGFRVFPLARVRGLIPADFTPQEVGELSSVFMFNALLSIDPHTDPRQLAPLDLCTFLEGQQDPDDIETDPTLRVIIFDQFEELLTAYPEYRDHRRRFFDQIHDVLTGKDADPLLRILLVFREDYIGQLETYARWLPDGFRACYRLGRLGEAAALKAIEGPLGRIHDRHVCIERDAAMKLVADLRTEREISETGDVQTIEGDDVEPVYLQLACQGLWRNLSPDVDVISVKHLQQFGKIDSALAQHYATAIESAIGNTEVSESELRNWFSHRLITPAGTRGTVFQEPGSTGGIPNDAVCILENHHVVRGDTRFGGRWLELTHDRFIEPISKSNEVYFEAAERRRHIRWTSILASLFVVAVITVVVAIARYNVYVRDKARKDRENVEKLALSFNEQAESRLNTRPDISVSYLLLLKTAGLHTTQESEDLLRNAIKRLRSRPETDDLKELDVSPLRVVGLTSDGRIASIVPNFDDGGSMIELRDPRSVDSSQTIPLPNTIPAKRSDPSRICLSEDFRLLGTATYQGATTTISISQLNADLTIDKQIPLFGNEPGRILLGFVGSRVAILRDGLLRVINPEDAASFSDSQGVRIPAADAVAAAFSRRYIAVTEYTVSTGRTSGQTKSITRVFELNAANDEITITEEPFACLTHDGFVRATAISKGGTVLFAFTSLVAGSNSILDHSIERWDLTPVDLDNQDTDELIEEAKNRTRR